MMRLILSLALFFPPLVLNTFYGEQKYDNILEKWIIFNEETKIYELCSRKICSSTVSDNFSIIRHLNESWYRKTQK